VTPNASPAVSSGIRVGVIPQTGHTANLEEPGAFNAAFGRFLAAAGRGAWLRRDPRSLSSSTTGIS
jgi:hypothetical protein